MSIVTDDLSRTTGILCFGCQKRHGIECPGRKKDESTLCSPCFIVSMLKDRYQQGQHMLNMLNNKEMTEEQFYKFCRQQELI